MTTNPIREITAVVVSWRDADEVEQAVESLAAVRQAAPADAPRASLVVVDNGSGLEARKRVAQIWPDASLLVNASNRGFGAAANQGARVATGDVVLFVNPDTRAQGDLFAEIARVFQEHPEVVAVAPRLTDWHEAAQPAGAPLAPPDSEDQRTFQLRRLPTLGGDARTLLLVDHLLADNRWRRFERYADRDRGEPFPIEQAAGAALAVRRTLFLEIGGFDERFFPAWFEDVDLCARLGQRGTILYWPSARLRHRGRVSSETLGYARFLPIYYTNALRYRARYPVWARLAYRSLLAAGMALRLAFLPLRRAVPRPRGEAAKAYVKTCAVALGWTPRGARLQAADVESFA